MAIPDDVLKQAWVRAGGQCECEKRTHSHFYVPCAKPLIWENRGKKGWGGWDIKHIDENKGDVASNLEVLCLTCFEIGF
jgi:hypothetical protein